MIDYFISELLDLYILWTFILSCIFGIIYIINRKLLNSLQLLTNVYYSFFILFLVNYLNDLYPNKFSFIRYDLIKSSEVNIFSNEFYQHSIIDLYSLLLSLYVFIVTFSLFHLLKQIGMLAYSSRKANMDLELTTRAKHISQKLNIESTIDVFTSRKLMSAYSFGFFKPVIVFPLGLKKILSEKDIDLILIHELIHIQQNDFLNHIIQTITKIIFSFNPLVWWMDKQLSVAREVRCDLAVLNADKDLKKYSKLLYFLATKWQEQLPETAVIAFYKPSHQLNRRVNMIKLKSKNGKLKRNSRIMSAFVLLIVFVIACSNSLEEQKINKTILNEVNEIESFAKEKIGKIIEFFDATVKPKIVKKGQIKYPEKAQKEGIEGMVLIQFQIDKEGVPTKLEIIEGIPLLNESALKAASEYRFTPAEIDGKKVSVMWQIPFRYKLKK